MPALIHSQLLASLALFLTAAALGSADPGTPQEDPKLTPQKRARYEEYFKIADFDDNGWISYREARESLEIDRLTYASFDIDRDGRIRPPEFEVRMLQLEDRAGGIQTPRRNTGPVLLPTRNSEQLRNAFDTNADGALEAFEIDQLLSTYRRQDVPTRIVMEKLDSNKSKKLELNELTALSQLLSATYTGGDERVPTPTREGALDELFGGLAEQPSADYQRTQHPPQIHGPVLPFRRLDLDGDGRVTLAELERLQRPLTLSVRLAAVLAALDTDGDETLDARELSDALD